MRERVESVARELAAAGLRAEHGKAQLLHTRREVERGWLALAGTLQRDGMSDLAEDVRRHVQRMPSVRTDREEIAHRLRARVRDNPARARFSVDDRGVEARPSACFASRCRGLFLRERKFEHKKSA